MNNKPLFENMYKMLEEIFGLYHGLCVSTTCKECPICDLCTDLVDAMRELITLLDE